MYHDAYYIYMDEVNMYSRKWSAEFQFIGLATKSGKGKKTKIPAHKQND